MITNQLRFYLFGLCLCFGLGLRADVPDLNVIGFSPDGHYFAFEQYGFNAGHGVPYSNMYFVDVEHNTYVTKPIIHEPPTNDLDADIEASQARVRNRSRIFAQNILKDLKLDYPQPGLRVIHHPLTDLGVQNNHVSFTPDMPLGGLSYDKYDLDLSLKRVGKNVSCKGMGTPKIFKLSLSHNDGKQQILQEDKHLPPSRGCPLNYRIQDVYLYQVEQRRYIAIVINVIFAGFEGQDMRYMVVTGLVKSANKPKKPKISLPPRPKAANDLPKTDKKPSLASDSQTGQTHD